MSQFTFKMPDLGEGTVDAEIVAWHTKPGDAVTEDQLIVEVMTDKAAVEVPAPVSGRVISITGAPGDKVAVGSPLIVFDVGGGAGENGAGQSSAAAPAAARRPASEAVPSAAPAPPAPPAPPATPPRPPRPRGPPRPHRPRVMAASWRRRRIGGELEKPASICPRWWGPVPADVFCVTICLRRPVRPARPRSLRHRPRSIAGTFPRKRRKSK